MVREISPHAAAHAVGVDPAVLRNWRRDDFHDYGARAGKGYVYSRQEVARLAVAGFIARYGIGLQGAFEIVKDRASQIDALVTGDDEIPQDYIITITLNADMDQGYSGVTGVAKDRVRFDGPVHGFLEVNISLLAKRALERAAFYVNHVGWEAAANERE
jgi:hypothetical protein